MNRKARLAWELYLKMETSGESFSLLQLIANDCYKVSYNLYSKNNLQKQSRGRHGRDHMVIGFTTTYAISAYHHVDVVI